MHTLMHKLTLQRAILLFRLLLLLLLPLLRLLPLGHLSAPPTHPMATAGLLGDIKVKCVCVD